MCGTRADNGVKWGLEYRGTCNLKYEPQAGGSCPGHTHGGAPARSWLPGVQHKVVLVHAIRGDVHKIHYDSSNITHTFGVQAMARHVPSSHA